MSLWKPNALRWLTLVLPAIGLVGFPGCSAQTGESNQRSARSGSVVAAGGAAITGGAGALGGRASGGSANAFVGGSASGGSSSGGSSAILGSGGSGGALVSVGGTGGSSTAAGGATGGVNQWPSGGAPVVAGCAGTNYLLCEDFESTQPAAIPAGWTQHGNAQVAADEARHGTHSLKVEPATNGERRIRFPAQSFGSKHWGRIFYKLKLPVPDAFVHSTLVALSGSGPTIGAAEYRVVDTVKQAIDTPDVGSRYQFLYNVQPQNSAEFGEGTSYDRAFDGAWHCAEWYIDASDQSYSVYWDGAQQISFTKGAGRFAGSEIPTEFSELRIGLNNYQAAPPGFTVWIDDVAVAHSRIGCE